jgi:hypothetical protein
MGKFSFVYKGFYAEAERVGKDKIKGRMLNAPDPTPLESDSLPEMQTSFTWIVERLIKEGVEPGPPPKPTREEAASSPDS